MPFSAKSLDFLFENRLNDSKVWFNEHKEDYKKYVIEPFAELICGLSDTMLEIDEQFICDPRKLSRIYRDARYAKGKSIFRDYVWYSFRRPRDENRPLPEFYFSVSPEGFEYGCGYYCAGTDTMETIRKMVIEDDKSFKKADKAYKNQDIFELYGEMYKRSRYPDESAEKQNWLNRKNMGLNCKSKDFALLFSDKLIEKAAADFKMIAPIYDFFMKAESCK